MPIRKVEGELLTDCFRPYGLPVPGCVYLRTAHHSWDSFFHRHSDYMPNGLAMVDYNHFCSDYRTFVNHGMKSRLADIQEARGSFAADAEKLAFLDGIEVVLDAIRELCERYGQRVPYEPASTFAEAVQAVWFTFLLTPDSVGRLDSVRYPFYKREKEAGTLTDDGTLHDGFTELSRLILKVRTELPIWRPQVRTKMGFLLT